MLKAGDVVLASIQFTDTFEIKKRPALVLFEEFDGLAELLQELGLGHFTVVYVETKQVIGQWIRRHCRAG